MKKHFSVQNKKNFCQFPKKCFKTAEILNLVVCRSFSREKHFFFYLKEMFFCQFPYKCFKTAEIFNLAVCVSFSREKHFFDKKVVLYHIP